MTGWLLDTHIVSQLAPGKDGAPRLERRFGEWLDANTARAPNAERPTPMNGSITLVGLIMPRRM